MVRLPTRINRSPGLPYLAFHVDDYLDEAADIALSTSFPEELMVHRMGGRLAANVDLTEDSADVKQFLESNPVWREYVAAWQSPEQFEHLMSIFGPAIRARYNSLWRWILAPRITKRRNLIVSVALTAYRRGFRLSPHSDDKFKLLSLIHYLPTADSTTGAAGGTIFFAPKPGINRGQLRQFSEWARGLRRYLPLWCSPLIESSLSRVYADSDRIDEAERRNFNDCFVRSTCIEYRRNRISGFVKNDWTMHEVDLSEYPADHLRRAVLINIRLRPTRLAMVIPNIERVLSLVKRRIRHGGALRPA